MLKLCNIPWVLLKTWATERSTLRLELHAKTSETGSVAQPAMVTGVRGLNIYLWEQNTAVLKWGDLMWNGALSLSLKNMAVFLRVCLLMFWILERCHRWNEKRNKKGASRHNEKRNKKGASRHSEKRNKKGASRHSDFCCAPASAHPGCDNMIISCHCWIPLLKPLLTGMNRCDSL